MARLTKFTISPNGSLVYKSSGKLAPESYTFRKNTVYGADGRRIGTLSRNLTKGEAAKIAKAERSREARTRRAERKPSKPSQKRPKKPSKTVKAATYGEVEEFDTTEFPEESPAVIAEFAQRVKDAALSVAPAALQQKIRALSDRAIYKAYTEDAFIFETYFRYHSPVDAPHKSDVSVWLYQFVKRIETYTGV